jgi:hypothetical protein
MREIILIHQIIDTLLLVLENTFLHGVNGQAAVLIQNLPTNQNTNFDSGSSTSSAMLSLAANDYIELYGRFNWNSNATVGNFYSNSSRSTWLCGYRIA